MRKTIFHLLAMALMLSGCAIKRDVTAIDQGVAAYQKEMYVSCRDTLKKVDTSKLSADQLERWQLVEALKDSNKLLAKVPLDECAGAGGTNINDVLIAESKEATKQTESFFDFGKTVVKSAAEVAEVFVVVDGVKSLAENAGTKVFGNNNEIAQATGNSTVNTNKTTFTDSFNGEGASATIK